METNTLELLDAYLRGTLSPEEQLQVEQRLQTDESFRQDYTMHQMMVTAITENRKAELKNFIRNNVKVKSVPFFRTPVFYAAAAASVVLCVLSFFVISRKLNEERTASNPTPIESPAQAPAPVPTAAGADTIQTTVASGKASKPKEDLLVDVPAKKESSDSRLQTVDSDKSQPQDVVMSGQTDDVKVEADKMIYDSVWMVARRIYIAKPKAYQSNPNDLYAIITTGDKLRLEVQIWQSPINFNGYRLNKNLLTIYGNFDPSQMVFQELRDILFVKYRNDYYRFTPGETYYPMHKETDAKIISDLEQFIKK